MKYELYPVAAEWDPGARAWSILAPDFPEIASVATAREDIAQTAADAIQTAIEARRESHEALPAATIHADFTRSWGFPTDNMLVHVPVSLDVAPEPVRVNVSLDKQLLQRIDSEATRRGMSRSAFLAEGARTLLRA